MVFSISLEQLDTIVEKESIHATNEKLDKFELLFEVMKKFFHERKIILYGGTAMNLHLPKTEKIYDENDFPDFDCFSMNPKKDSELLANLFSKKNYKYIEIKHAIHDGTYKLYVDFEPICDLTQITKQQHKVLMKSTELIDGFYVTSVKHLKSAAYLELCIPKSSLFRWNKVLSRIKILEEEFRNNRSIHSTKLIQETKFTKKIENVVNKLKDISYETGLVLCGNNAIRKYMNNQYELNNISTFLLTNSMGLFECMSKEVKDTIKSFKSVLTKSKCKNIRVETTSDDFITPYTKIFISYNDTIYTHDTIELNICTIYHVDDHCYSYISDKDTGKFASIFFVLHVLYFSLYKRSKEAEVDRVNIKNIINILIKTITIDNFKTECYGKELTINEIRRDRWNKGKKVVMLRV